MLMPIPLAYKLILKVTVLYINTGRSDLQSFITCIYTQVRNPHHLEEGVILNLPKFKREPIYQISERKMNYMELGLDSLLGWRWKVGKIWV